MSVVDEMKQRILNAKIAEIPANANLILDPIFTDLKKRRGELQANMARSGAAIDPNLYNQPQYTLTKEQVSTYLDPYLSPMAEHGLNKQATIDKIYNEKMADLNVASNVVAQQYGANLNPTAGTPYEDIRKNEIASITYDNKKAKRGLTLLDQPKTTLGNQTTLLPNTLLG